MKASIGTPGMTKASFIALAPHNTTRDNGTMEAVVADAIDGIRDALESRLAVLEKSAQRGRLAQQH
jgi:hypothetical protein